MHLTIPKINVIKESEVKSMKNVNSWHKGRISCCSRNQDGKIINLSDYTTNEIKSTSNFLILIIENAINDLEEGAVLKNINVQVNLTLGEKYRSNIEKQLQLKYGHSVKINVQLDESLSPKAASYADIDYETTSKVTVIVPPVVITP